MVGFQKGEYSIDMDLSWCGDTLSSCFSLTLVLNLFLLYLAGHPTIRVECKVV